MQAESVVCACVIFFSTRTCEIYFWMKIHVPLKSFLKGVLMVFCRIHNGLPTIQGSDFAFSHFLPRNKWDVGNIIMQNSPKSMPFGSSSRNNNIDFPVLPYTPQNIFSEERENAIFENNLVPGKEDVVGLPSKVREGRGWLVGIFLLPPPLYGQNLWWWGRGKTHNQTRV